MTKQALNVIDSFTIGTFNDSVVTVRLQSIQHLADRNDEVANDFTVILAVNGAGEVLPYNEQVTLNPGTSKSVGGVFNHFNYDNTSCGSLLNTDMTFVATVITSQTSATFQGNAKGMLTPGTLSFRIPMVLESGNRKSTIVLRGRVDVSCPNS